MSTLNEVKFLLDIYGEDISWEMISPTVVTRVLLLLTERQNDVIRKYYGLGNTPKMTGREIGASLINQKSKGQGITAIGVWQIIDKARRDIKRLTTEANLCKGNSE